MAQNQSHPLVKLLALASYPAWQTTRPEVVPSHPAQRHALTTRNIDISGAGDL